MRPWEDYAGSMAYEEPTSSPSYWSDLPQEPYIYEEPYWEPAPTPAPVYNASPEPYIYEEPVWEQPRPSYEYEEPNPLWEAPAINWNNPMAYNEAASVLARPRPSTQFVMPYENPAYGGPEQYVPEPDTQFDYFPGQTVIERPPLQGPIDWTSSDPKDWTLDPEERRKLGRAYFPGEGVEDMFYPGQGIEDFLTRPVPQRMGSGGTDWNDLTYNELVTPEERQQMFDQTLNWADILDASTPLGQTIGPRTSNLPLEEERRLSMLPRRPEGLTEFGDVLAGDRWGTGPTLEEEAQAEFGMWQWAHPTEARTLSIEEQLHEFEVEKNSGALGLVNLGMEAFVYLRDDWVKPAFIQSINYMEHPTQGQQEFKKLLEGDVSWQELSARREDLKVQYEAEMEAMGMFETPVRLFLDVFLDPFTYASLGLNKAMSGARIAGAEAFAELSAVEKIVAAGNAGIRLTPAQQAVLTASQAGKYVAPEVAEAAVANAGNASRIAQLFGRDPGLTLPNSVSAAAVGKPLTGWQALVDNTPTLLRELIDNGNLETIIAFNIAGEIVNQSGVLQMVDDPLMQTALGLGLSVGGAVAGVTAFKAAPPVLKSAYNIADGMAYAHIVQQYPGLLDSNSAARNASQAWKEAAGNAVMAARISAEFALQYPGPAIDALWNAVKEGVIPAARAATVIDDALRMPGMEGVRAELTPGRAPIGINAAAQREVDLEQAALGGGQQTVFGKNMVSAQPANIPDAARVDTAGTLSPRLLPARADLEAATPHEPLVAQLSRAQPDEGSVKQVPQPPANADGVASIYGGAAVGHVPAYIIRNADGTVQVTAGGQVFDEVFASWPAAKQFLEANGGKNVTALQRGSTVLISGRGDVITLQPYGKGDVPKGFLGKVNGTQLGERFKTFAEAVDKLPAAISAQNVAPGDASTWRPANTPGINWKYQGDRATTTLPNGKTLTLRRPEGSKIYHLIIPGSFKGEKATTYHFTSRDDALNAIKAAFDAAGAGIGPGGRAQLAAAGPQRALPSEDDMMRDMEDPDWQHDAENALFGGGPYYGEDGREIALVQYLGAENMPTEQALHYGLLDENDQVLPHIQAIQAAYSEANVLIHQILGEAGLTGFSGPTPAEPAHELGITTNQTAVAAHMYQPVPGEEGLGAPTGRIYANPWTMVKRAEDAHADAVNVAREAGEVEPSLEEMYVRESIDVLIHEVAHWSESHDGPLGDQDPEWLAYMDRVMNLIDEERYGELFEIIDRAVTPESVALFKETQELLRQEHRWTGTQGDLNGQLSEARGPAGRGDDSSLLPPGAGREDRTGIGAAGLAGDGEGALRQAGGGALDARTAVPDVRGIDDRTAARTIEPGGSAAPRGLGLISNPKQIIHTTPDGQFIRVTSNSFMGEAVGASPEELTVIGIADANGKLHPFYGPLFTELEAIAGDVNELGRVAGLTGAAGSYTEAPPNVGLTYQMGVYGRRGLDLEILAASDKQVPIGEINLNPYTLLTRAESVLQDAKQLRDDITDEHLPSYYAGEMLMTLVHESAHAVELHGKNAREFRDLRYRKGDKPFNQALADLWNQIDRDRQRAMIVAIRGTLSPEAMAGIRTGRDGVYSPRRSGAPNVQAGRGNASEVLQSGAGEADAAGTGAGGLPAAEGVRPDQGAGAEGVPGLPAAGVRGTDVDADVATRLADLIREIIRGEQPATPERPATAGAPVDRTASIVDPEELRLAKQEAMETGDYSKVDALNESMAPKPGEGTPPGYIKDPRPAPTLQKLSDEELARQLANAQERRDSFWGDNADEDVAYEQADQVMQQARMEGIRRVIQNPELAIETASVDNGVVTVVFRDNPLTRTLLSEAGGKMEQEIPVAVWQRYFGEPPAEVREQFQTGMITDRELRQAYPNSFLMSQRGINGEPGLKVGGAYLAQADALKNFFIQQGKDDLPELDDYLAKYPIERASGTTPLDAVVNRIGGEGGGVKSREALENLRTALRSMHEGQEGVAQATFMSEAGLTAAASTLGYLTADEDEDRNLRAAQFGIAGAAFIPALKGVEYGVSKVKGARVPPDAKAVPQQAPHPFGTMPRAWVEQFFGKDVADKAWLEWTARNAELSREARDVSDDIRKKSGSVLNTTYEHIRDWFDPNAKVPDEALRTVNTIEAVMNTAFEGVVNTLKGPDAKGLTKKMSWDERFHIFQAVEQPERYMRFLSPEQKQVAQTLRTTFDMVGRAAVDAGIFSPEMIKKNPNYISHMWDYLSPDDFYGAFKGAGGSEPRVRKAAPELKREWTTIEEAINATDPENRLVLPQDFDPVDIAGNYANIMYRRIAGEKLKQWIEANHDGGDEAFVTEREWGALPASQQAKYVEVKADPLTQPRFSNQTQATLTAVRGFISNIDTGIRRAERWAGVYGDRAHQLETLAYKNDELLDHRIGRLSVLEYRNAEDVQTAISTLDVRHNELVESLKLLNQAISSRTGARFGERDAKDAFKVAEAQMKKLDASAAALQAKYADQGMALALAEGGAWKDDLAREIIQITKEQTRTAEQMRTLAGRIATAEVVAGKLALEAGVRQDLGTIFDDMVGSLRRDVRQDIYQLEESAKAVGRREAAPLTAKINGRIDELTERIQQLERMTMKERGKIPGLEQKVKQLKDAREVAASMRDDLMQREQKESSPLLVRKDYQPLFERYKAGWEGSPILGTLKDAANSLTRTVLSGPIDLYMLGATAKTALAMGLTPGVRTVSTTGMGQALYHAAIAAVNPEHRAQLQEMNAPIREKLRAAGMGLGVDAHDIQRMVRGQESATLPGRILPGKVGKGYESMTRMMEEAQFSGWIDTLKTMLGADVAARHMKNGMEENKAWQKAAKTMDMAFGGKNMRASGHRTATNDLMRFLLLAPNWFMTRGELFVDVVNPTSWRGSYGKQWAVQTAFMGGLASLLATSVYSAFENDGPPDWSQVVDDWWRSAKDPRHFMEVKTPDGQFVSLLNWEKDIVRFPVALYYMAKGDMDAADEALGPYIKARQNILPRLLYDITMNKTFTGKNIYDDPKGMFDLKGMGKAAGQIALSAGIESQPQFLSETEKVIPNKWANALLPGSPFDEDKTLGESMGQGRNTIQGVAQNMTGLGRARSLTPIQMALQDDIEKGLVPRETRDYSRLSSTEKKEFKIRHKELKDYFDSNLPEPYVDIIADSDKILEANDQAAIDLKVTVSDWKAVYGDEMIRRGTAGDYAFPDGTAPKSDKERELLNEWYGAFDAVKDERGKIDQEKLDASQQDFFVKYGEEGINLVETYQLLGKGDMATLNTLIYRQLDKDGYWDMKKTSINPDFRGTTVPEEELRRLKLELDNLAAKDPESKYINDRTKLFYYGEQLGIDDDVLYDIGLLGSDRAESLELQKYKEDHPGFMAWLAGNLLLDGTIAKLQMQGFKVPQGLTGK